MATVPQNDPGKGAATKETGNEIGKFDLWAGDIGSQRMRYDEGKSSKGNAFEGEVTKEGHGMSDRFYLRLLDSKVPFASFRYGTSAMLSTKASHKGMALQVDMDSSMKAELPFESIPGLGDVSIVVGQTKDGKPVLGVAGPLSKIGPLVVKAGLLAEGERVEASLGLDLELVGSVGAQARTDGTVSVSLEVSSGSRIDATIDFDAEQGIRDFMKDWAMTQVTLSTLPRLGY